MPKPETPKAETPKPEPPKPETPKPEPPKPETPKPERLSPAAARKARLAAELRANLAKRKAQARARRAGDDNTPADNQTDGTTPAKSPGNR